MNIQQQLIEQGYPLTSQYFHGCRGLASKLAHKYGKSTSEEDFVQVALEAACKAETRFNPECGASFYTYINKIIKNSIQKSFGNPNRHTKAYKIVQKFIDDYGRQHTHYPDVYEISKGTGLSRFDILSIYYDRYKEQPLDSIDDGIMSDPFQNKDYAWVTEHLDCLEDDELYVIESMFTYEQTLDGIATAMGIPKASVFRIRESALDKLRDSIKSYE